MKEYLAYKEWWMKEQCPSITSLSYEGNSEEAFEQHVKDLGLYGLMETLINWMEEDE